MVSVRRGVAPFRRADIAGDVEGLRDDAARIEVGVVQQCERGRARILPAGTNRHELVFGLDNVAVARNDQ